MEGDGDHERRTLLIVTGGIAAYRSCELVRELQRQGCSVKVVMTKAATQFVQPMTFEALSGRKVALDLFPGCTEGEIDHITLARWAEVVAVAPASADFIAKAYAGIADDLASCVLLALEKKVPVVWFPAMNVEMWTHPATQRNIKGLAEMKKGWHSFVEPVSKKLACGEVGLGGLPDPVDIARRILHAITPRARVR